MEYLKVAWSSSSAWAFVHVPRILLVVVVAAIGSWLLRSLISRAVTRAARSRDGEGAKRANTLQGTVASLVSTIVWLVAVASILAEVGIDVGPLIAAAGIVGVALGFGAQKLVQDVISGFFILLEDQIRVGDVVKLDDHAGLVEKVGLRITQLRDLSGSVHYIRNGSIGAIVNMTKEFSYYVMDVGVAYRENVDEVIEVMKRVGAELRGDPDYADDLMDDLEVFGLDRFDDSAVVVKARLKTKPIQQWKVGREYNRRLKAAFDAADIEIPFPQVTLHVGQSKQGDSAPLPVRFDGGRFDGTGEGLTSRGAHSGNGAG